MFVNNKNKLQICNYKRLCDISMENSHVNERKLFSVTFWRGNFEYLFIIHKRSIQHRLISHTMQAHRFERYLRAFQYAKKRIKNCCCCCCCCMILTDETINSIWIAWQSTKLTKRVKSHENNVSKRKIRKKEYVYMWKKKTECTKWSSKKKEKKWFGRYHRSRQRIKPSIWPYGKIRSAL